MSTGGNKEPLVAGPGGDDIEVRVTEPRDGSVSMTDDSGLEIIPDNEIYEGTSEGDENDEGFVIDD